MKQIVQEWLRSPTPAELVEAELEQAKVQLLLAQTGVEWAQSQVAYNEARIKRLISLRGAV